MKPISVRFRCFGPYIDEQVIRFDELAESGLFLICGETGAGKTTILDAVCCALYGSCSGAIRGELEAMRCKQAPAEEPTVVEFIFECDRQRYVFGRTLTPRRRRKEDAELTFNEDYSCVKVTDGVRVPLVDNAKKRSMNAKAEELIGLNLDQFRQVIILPQGKFETLLTSNSEDKEKLLSNLFHTERWKTAVDRMAEELNARKTGIDREMLAIREGLDRLQLSAVSELPEALAHAEEEEVKAAAAEQAAADGTQKARALLELDQGFAELDRRREKMETAGKTAAGDRELQTRLDMAQRAEKARRPYEEWQLAVKDLERAGARLKQTEEELAKAEEQLAKVKTEKTAQEAQAEDQARRESDAHRLSELRNRYENINVLQQAAGRAKKAREEAGQEAQRTKEAFDRAAETLEQRMHEWNNANEAYQQVTRAYQAATAGHLAAELQEGKACPVCGSTHHPDPAKLPEGSVTGRDIEAAEEKVTRVRKAYEAQDGIRRKEEEAFRNAEKVLEEAKSAFDKADGALQQELEQREPGLETLAELETRSRQLAGEIRAYNEQKEKLDKAFNDAVAGRDTQAGVRKDRQAEMESARAEHLEKETAWRQALAETGLGTETQFIAMSKSAEEQKQLQETISAHKAALDSAREHFTEQQEKMEGKQRPEPGTAQQAFREAEDRHNEAIRIHTLAAQKAGNLKQETKRLTEMDERIADRRAAYEKDSAFVQALRGSTGMNLQRYVLSVRLGQVIMEANNLLSGIYGGRYQLGRSNESYGNARKSGLELEVHDSLSDQRRSVCTLSGGEKFLVALSLAIGLCTVVQNEQKGVNLEAMFIDEGFGSLDQNTLGDALDVLQSVRRGRGLVGIISHVALLEETIPTKIEIRKTARGSTASVIRG